MLTLTTPGWPRGKTGWCNLSCARLKLPIGRDGKDQSECAQFVGRYEDIYAWIGLPAANQVVPDRIMKTPVLRQLCDLMGGETPYMIKVITRGSLLSKGRVDEHSHVG